MGDNFGRSFGQSFADSYSESRKNYLNYLNAKAQQDLAMQMQIMQANQSIDANNQKVDKEVEEILKTKGLEYAKAYKAQYKKPLIQYNPSNNGYGGDGILDHLMGAVKGFRNAPMSPPQDPTQPMRVQPSERAKSTLMGLLFPNRAPQQQGVIVPQGYMGQNPTVPDLNNNVGGEYDQLAGYAKRLEEKKAVEAEEIDAIIGNFPPALHKRARAIAGSSTLNQEKKIDAILALGKQQNQLLPESSDSQFLTTKRKLIGDIRAAKEIVKRNPDTLGFEEDAGTALKAILGIPLNQNELDSKQLKKYLSEIEQGAKLGKNWQAKVFGVGTPSTWVNANSADQFNNDLDLILNDALGEYETRRQTLEGQGKIIEGYEGSDQIVPKQTIRGEKSSQLNLDTTTGEGFKKAYQTMVSQGMSQGEALKQSLILAQKQRQNPSNAGKAVGGVSGAIAGGVTGAVNFPANPIVAAVGGALVGGGAGTAVGSVGDSLIDLADNIRNNFISPTVESIRQHAKQLVGQGIKPEEAAKKALSDGLKKTQTSKKLREDLKAKAKIYNRVNENGETETVIPIGTIMSMLSGNDSKKKDNISSTDFIKNAEGFRGAAYQDEGGNWTIGYGSTRVNGQPVQPDMTITREEAEGQLNNEYTRASNLINSTVKAALTPNQKESLKSFIYNAGSGAFQKNVLPLLNRGDIQGALKKMSQFVYVDSPGGKQVSKGLINRRNKEIALFSQGVSNQQ